MMRETLPTAKSSTRPTLANASTFGITPPPGSGNARLASPTSLDDSFMASIRVARACVSVFRIGRSVDQVDVKAPAVPRTIGQTELVRQFERERRRGGLGVLEEVGSLPGSP